MQLRPPSGLAPQPSAAAQKLLALLRSLAIDPAENWAHVTVTRVDDHTVQRIIRPNIPGIASSGKPEITPNDFRWRKEWSGYELQYLGLLETVTDLPGTGYVGLYERETEPTDWIALRLLQVVARPLGDEIAPYAVARWDRTAAPGSAPKTSIADAYGGDGNTVTPDHIKRAWDGFPLIWALEGVGRTGAPEGERVWPLEVFRPTFEERWRAAREAMGRPPGEVDVWANMPPPAGETAPASLATFRRRWKKCYPGKKWRDLTF